MKNKIFIIPLLMILLAASKPAPTAANEDAVSVSPGRYDYKLGEDFPREDKVKLDYPKSTILINSTGELLFNVTLTTFNYASGEDSESIIKSISIYIPPEFTINNGVASIWTSLTNDYSPSSISLTKALPNDPIAPNWSVITIHNLNITKSREDVKNRVFLENKTQYIRVFNVTSPSIAGRYFFKVFVTVGGMAYSIGAGNFPTIVVKAALNPAYISGVVRHGGPSFYGEPLDSTIHADGTILLPEGYGGRVYAEGLTADGRKVEAQAYFNATSGGRYTLYGLAAGTYNITVQAAGYPPQTALEGVSVAEGQSLENVDLYVTEGAAITGTVFSKHGLNEIPWGYVYNLTYGRARRTIRIDITDLNENLIASSPLRIYDKPRLIFRPRDVLDPFSTSYSFSIKREVSFDGHIPQDYANYTSGIPPGDYYVKVHVVGYIQMEPAVVHVNKDTREVKTAIDLQRSNYFEVTVYFKRKRGDVEPTPTRVGGYLYIEVLDEAGIVVGFNASYVPKGSETFTVQVRGVDIWNRLLSDQSKRMAWLYSRDRGLLPGTYEINALFVNRTVDLIAVNALILTSPELRMKYPATTEPLIASFPPQALELTNRLTPLYFQLEMIEGSIGGFCDSATKLSLELVQGGGFNLTLYPVDWQRPPIIREWAHPGARLRIDIQTSSGELIDSLYATQPPVGRSVTISTLGEIKWEDGTTLFGRALGLKPGVYILKVYTPGYLEDSSSPLSIPVALGAISDARANLLRGASIDLTLVFKTEHLLDPINNKLPYARPINNIDATPVRIEVFDEAGKFVAANATYAPTGSGSLRVSIDGFNRYYGNPRLLWTNFYDTTDGNGQDDSGLDEGFYQIRVTVEGYYQAKLASVRISSGEVGSRPTVSLVVSVERLGYVSGTVLWVDKYGEANPLSWACVTAYRGNGFEEAYTYSLDGFYEMWLAPGRYDFGLYHPGFETKYLRYGLHVGWASRSSINFFMN